MKKLKCIINVLLIPLLFINTSCTKQDLNLGIDDLLISTKIMNNDNIDLELKPYFQSFVNDAAKRRIYIDFDAKGISGVIEDINTNEIAGLCTHSEKRPRRIVIDKKFWSMANSMEKEFLVFHELGHCYLDRGHDDSTNEQTFCNSIMRSGFSGCITYYNHKNRESFLDELFSKN